MRALLLALSLLAAGCSGSSTCTNLVHAACDLDAGSGCPAHQACIDAYQAIDPCATGASACCFQVCSTDSDCPTNQLCTQGTCAQGRCAQ